MEREPTTGWSLGEDCHHSANRLILEARGNAMRLDGASGRPFFETVCHAHLVQLPCILYHDMSSHRAPFLGTKHSNFSASLEVDGYGQHSGPSAFRGRGDLAGPRHAITFRSLGSCSCGRIEKMFSRSNQQGAAGYGLAFIFSASGWDTGFVA